MRKTLVAALGVIFVVGCNLPQTDIIDVARIKGCKRFKWNGRVVVTQTHKGLFAGYSVDSITLEARDGRKLLLRPGFGRLETFVSAEVEPQSQPSEAPARAAE